MTGPVIVHGDSNVLYFQPTTDVADPAQICLTGADLRLLIATVFPSPGVLSLNDWTITAQNSAILNIGTGSAIVAGNTAAEQRSYIARNTAGKTIQPPGPPTTSNRYDLICLKVHDGQVVLDHLYEWQVQCISGQEASTPAVPALPSDSIALAAVIRRPGAANIAPADITDVRSIALLPSQPQSQKYWKSETTASSATFTTTEARDTTVPVLVLNVTNAATVYRIRMVQQVSSNTADRTVISYIRDSGGTATPTTTSTAVAQGNRTCRLANTGDTLIYQADLTLAVGTHTFAPFNKLLSGTGTGTASANTVAKKQLTAEIVG